MSAPGRLVWPGALLALLGLLFTATVPGLSVVAMAGPTMEVAGILGVYVCHAAGTPRADPTGADIPRSESCCLICQVAQLAGTAGTPSVCVLPSLRESLVRIDGLVRIGVDGAARGHAQARAPPAV